MADSAFLKKLMTARNHVIGLAWGGIKARWAGEALNDALSIGFAPIGAILPWHDYNGTLTVPTGWALCNGATVSDADSPLNGKALPNLNVDVASGGPWFLGGYATIGNTPTTVNSNLPTHTHSAGSYAVGSHTHGPGTLTYAIASTVAGAVTQPARDTTHTASTQLVGGGATAATTPTFGGSSGTPSIGDSSANNFPQHLKVKFIIRFK